MGKSPIDSFIICAIIAPIIAFFVPQLKQARECEIAAKKEMQAAQAVQIATQLDAAQK